MNYAVEGIPLFIILVGVVLMLGAEKITQDNLRILLSYLSDAEEQRKRCQNEILRFVMDCQIATLHWQIKGWRGVAGKPTMILMGVLVQAIGVFLFLHPNGW